MDKEDPLDILYINEPATGDQLQALKDAEDHGDDRSVEGSLERLRHAARDESVHTMPFIIDAVRVCATVGETFDALRNVFGTDREPALF